MNTENNLFNNIQNLENGVLDLENKILEYSQKQQKQEVKILVTKLKAELKYLAIQTNGLKIDINEHRKIMDFLRVHYSFLQKDLACSNSLL